MDETKVQKLVKSLNRNIDDMRKNVTETVSIVCNMVNCFGVNAEEVATALAEFPTVRKKFLEYCQAWILWLNFAYKKNMYDGRNEIACRRGADIFIIIGFSVPYVNDVEKSFKDWHSNIEAELFAIKMGNEHKTLQQTFSQIVFYMLYEYGEYLPIDVNTKLKEAIENGSLQDRFWKMPMI